MLIFFQRGQAGNQLFQYVALRTIHRHGRLVFIGDNALSQIFDGVEVTYFPASGCLFYRNVLRTIRALLRAASRWGVIGSVKESPTMSGVEVKDGLLAKIYHCDDGFFQSERAFEAEVLDHFKLKQAHLEEAAGILARAGNRPKVFVHVRRGDYVRTLINGSPAVLPARWYRACIGEMQQRYESPFFVFVSDDIAYAEDVFGDINDKHISTAGEGADFALMAMCDGGILSASSFSWWGAYWAAKIRRPNTKPFFLAPRFWLGHRTMTWFPQTMESDWMGFR